MEKGYRGADGDIEPVPFECEEWGWPYYTTEHEQMFDNNHFRTEEEAWRSINRSWEAGISLISSALKEVRLQEDKLLHQLANETLKKEESYDKYREWKAKNER